MGRGFVSTSSQFLEHSATTVPNVPLTMACWIFPVSDTSQNHIPIGVFNSGSTLNFLEIQVNATLTTVQVVAVDGSSANTASTTIAPVANRWQHVCAAFYATNSRAIFLNGGGKGTSSVDKIATGLNRFGLGVKDNSSKNNYFNGLIAHPAIWNVALTDAEVLLLAQGEMPYNVRPHGLVAYWPLNTPGTKTEIDQTPWSPRRYDLTVTGATPANDPPMRQKWPFLQKRRLWFGPVVANNTYSETMTGGALVAGSATIAANYSLSMTSAGVLDAGSDVDQAAFNPTIASAGVVGAATATTQCSYSPTAIFTGVLGNGTNVDQANMNPLIASAGIVGAGAASDQGNFNSLATGGAIANGLAGSEVLILGNGGAITSGVADIQANCNPTATGGASAAGAANSEVIILGSGGATVGETSQPQANYGPISAGGAVGGGGAIAQAVCNPSIDGGALANGISLSPIIYFPASAGGTVANGPAQSLVVFNPISTGGAIACGQALVISTVFIFGGVLTTGSAELHFRKANPNRIARIRFWIGDEIFLKVPIGDSGRVSYQKAKVIGLCYGHHPVKCHYRTKDGMFDEDLVVSPSEYREIRNQELDNLYQTAQRNLNMLGQAGG